MNTDFISRQAVIDSLYDWSNHSMTDAETWHLRQVIGDIKSMPSVTPQEPVLDKIRAELQTKIDSIPYRYNEYDDGTIDGLEYAQEVIDKYKAEIEPQESEDKE